MIPFNHRNFAVLTGRVVKDPQPSIVGENLSKLSFVLATCEDTYYQGEKKEHTEFHRIELLGAKADQAQKAALKKGDMLIVTGKLYTSKYAKDGVDQYEYKLKPHDFDVLSRSAKI